MPSFGIRRAGLGAVQAPGVRLVLAEQRHRLGTVGPGGRQQLQLTQVRVVDHDGAVRSRVQGRLLGADVPRPRVAEPHRGQDVQGLGVRSGVGDPHRHQQIGRVGLDVVDLADPVAVVVEHAGVEQLVLRVELAPPAVLGQQVGVREGPLRIVVTPTVPGMTGHGVEVPPVLLDVLAMVALGAGETEHPLLEDRVATVPQRQTEAQALLDVGEPGHAVLTPAVRARAGMVVGEVRPRIAVLAVVLAHRAPLAFTDVRPPQVPVAGLAQTVLQLAERVDPCPLRTRHRVNSLVSVRDAREDGRRAAGARRCVVNAGSSGPDRSATAQSPTSRFPPHRREWPLFAGSSRTGHPPSAAAAVRRRIGHAGQRTPAQRADHLVGECPITTAPSTTDPRRPPCDTLRRRALLAPPATSPPRPAAPAWRERSSEIYEAASEPSSPRSDRPMSRPQVPPNCTEAPASLTQSCASRRGRRRRAAAGGGIIRTGRSAAAAPANAGLPRSELSWSCDTNERLPTASTATGRHLLRPPIPLGSDGCPSTPSDVSRGTGYFGPPEDPP